MFHFLSTKIYLVWVGSFAAIISYSLYWNIHGNYPACNHCDIKIVLYIILADNNGVKIQLVRFRENSKKEYLTHRKIKPSVSIEFRSRDSSVLWFIGFLLNYLTRRQEIKTIYVSFSKKLNAIKELWSNVKVYLLIH